MDKTITEIYLTELDQAYNDYFTAMETGDEVLERKALNTIRVLRRTLKHGLDADDGFI